MGEVEAISLGEMARVVCSGSSGRIIRELFKHPKKSRGERATQRGIVGVMCQQEEEWLRKSDCLFN